MKKILVIGASGFVGKNLANQLLKDGFSVRCLARTPEKIKDLADLGCQVVKGDVLDKTSVQNTLQSVDAVYISIHTLSKQPADTEAKNFMDIELVGLQNIIDACKKQNVKRVIYVTLLGASENKISTWAKGRWQGEQLLFKSGLNATAIRPGMIVGIGGQGYNSVVANAQKKRVMLIGDGKFKMTPIAVSDLVYYLIGILDDERSFGQSFDVGNDEAYTMPQMIDIVAGVLEKPHPKKFYLPLSLLRFLAPLIERIGKLPKGAIKGLADGTDKEDMTGDFKPIRAILPKKLLTFREASEIALRHSNL